MAYIGVQPRLGNFQACDAITTSSTATFNLLVGGVAVFPQSAQHCLVSLNGVLQAPISSYTISGSTIVFASALTSADSIDFITILGDTLDLGVPSDDTVGAAQIKADLISGTTALTDEPADTDEFLVSDAGTLKRIDYSLIKGSGITQADQWRLTANVTGTNAVLTANLSQVSGAVIGSGMSESSGIFTFPATGVYLIISRIEFANVDAGDNVFCSTNLTTDNSSYTEIDRPSVSNPDSSNAAESMTIGISFVDITNTSTHKVRFETESMGSGSIINGDANSNETTFSFIRLGDT